MSNTDRLADEITKLSLTLFAASVAASSFLYSVLVQFERSGLPTSTWSEMIHATSLAGISFILAFFTGIAPRLLTSRRKTIRISRGVSFGLFGLGLILLISVSIILWYNTF